MRTLLYTVISIALSFLNHLSAQNDLFQDKQVLFEVSNATSPDRGFVAGDFNGDGLLDFGGLVAEGLSIFLHNGDLMYDTMVVRASFELPVGVADMNNDGRTDLISSDAFYMLDASGVVTRRVFEFDGIHRIRFAKDMFNDGFADVVSEVDDPGEDPVMYLHRNADGQTFESTILDNTRDNYDFALATDYTRDGRQDLLIADLFGQRIYRYQATPGGSFIKSAINVTPSLAGTFLAAADLDGDQDIDIIPGPASGFENLYYLENVNFNFSAVHDILPFTEPITIELFDLDGDLDKDIIGIFDESGNYELGYVLNLGNDMWSQFVYMDSFSKISPLAYVNPNVFDNWLHVTDVDSDGRNDIVVSANSSGEIRWYKGLLTSSTSHNPKYHHLQFFPQPAHDFVICPEIEAGENVLTISDLNGNKVYGIGVSSGDKIHIARLATGVYFYELKNRNNGALWTGKLIKTDVK